MPNQRRIRYLKVENYRSIHEEVTVLFPENMPLVLMGENNAGKSNIIRSLDLVLGEYWAGSHIPADNEFWCRDSEYGPIEIEIGLEGVLGNRDNPVRSISWSCENSRTEPSYKANYNGNSFYVNNAIREQCTIIVIGADRRLSYQMSYASKWTLLSKLMQKFHRHLTSAEDRVERLKEKFAEIKDIFREVEEFSNFQLELQNQFDEMLAGMTYQLGIDFSAYDPSNYFHSLKIFPSEANITRTFEELGTGQEQILAIAFAHAYAKSFYGGIVLIIEEPEAHLHPLAQLWLGKRITEMAADGLQIVISTHSPAFLNMLNLPGFVLVSKEDNATRVKQVSTTAITDYCIEKGAHPDRTSADTILPFYAASATQEIMAGFFAKKVILVEGSTEQLALPEYLSRVKFDVEKEGVAIIPVGGKGSIAKWWRLFTAFNIPVYIIFDNDSNDDNQGNKRKESLNTIGIDLDTADELILSTDWIIEDKYSIFGTDFEVNMRSHFTDYIEKEEEAIDLFGTAKPIVARFVAKNLEFRADCLPGIKKLIRLKWAIQKLE